MDLLKDFKVGTGPAENDMIGLFNGVGGFIGFTTKGGLTADGFVLGSTATKGQAQVLYDQASGKLFYDADGTGATGAVQFATLDAASRPLLSHLNFLIY